MLPKMVICCPIMNTWISNMHSWIAIGLRASQSVVFFRLMKKFGVALLTCIFALGGAAVGAFTGAIKGQTTETGLSRGFGVGAVAGAITGIQLMDLIANGEPFSKVALIHSLVNGKIFMEWVSPAVLKAYQWQVSATETSLWDFSDIFDINTFMGLSQDAIKELPVYESYNSETTPSCFCSSCTICLQDLEEGESIRLLPSCNHIFHLGCIDEWLAQQGSCPTCRKDV